MRTEGFFVPDKEKVERRIGVQFPPKYGNKEKGKGGRIMETEKTTATGEIVQEESALKVHKLTFWEAALIIVGANIGSGILGLAYGSRLAGWPVLLMWLVVAGVFTTASMLYVAETSLRTEKPFQLPGLAEKYVGSIGSWLVFLAVMINTIGCLIAYTSGSGRVLNALFGISNPLGSILFTIPAVVVVWLGLKATGVAEKIISWGMIAMVIAIIIASFLNSNTELSNAFFTKWTYAVPIFNLAIFCYIAQYAVPELARGLRHTPKKLGLSIVVGMGMTFVLLALVPLAMLSLIGPENMTEVGTIAWGEALNPVLSVFVNLFAICAMITSYWAVAGSALTNIVDKFKMKSETHIPTRIICVLLVAAPPFILAYSGLIGFVDAIGYAGAFGGTIMSILPVMMLRKARKNGDREPEWTCGWVAHPIIQGLMIVLFCGASLYALLSIFKVLPAGW